MTFHLYTCELRLKFYLFYFLYMKDGPETGANQENKVITSVIRSCMLKIQKGMTHLKTEKRSNEEQEDPRHKYYKPSHEGRGT